MVVGRIVHISIDLVLVSACLAGIKCVVPLLARLLLIRAAGDRPDLGAQRPTHI